MQPGCSTEKTYYAGMDLLRYFLAAVVMYVHTYVLTGRTIPLDFSYESSVGGFFAISGFLVSRSRQKHTGLRSYVGARMRRLMPQYLFIVLACAFGFAAVSTLGVTDYFFNRQWLRYVVANVTCLNFLQPSLPGVFDGAPFVMNSVNGALWTMKIDWLVYLTFPAFVWLARRRGMSPAMPAATVIVFSIACRCFFAACDAAAGQEFYTVLRRTSGMACYYYCGVLVWQYRQPFVRYRAVILPTALVLFAALPRNPWLDATLSPLLFSAIVMAISLWPMRLRWLPRTDNVSYNMYLFHFPIIQLSVYWGIAACSTAAELAFVFAATVALSVAVQVLLKRLMRKKRVLN